MFLKKLRIHNYKSLRNVCFTPEPFAALIGPNASGKSNFADAVHFLSEVYEHGLETAIARKGGYENIAFRKKRRTTAAIEFEITIQLTGESDLLSSKKWKLKQKEVELTHNFSFRAKTSGIRAEFEVVEDSFTISRLPTQTNGQALDLIRLSKAPNQRIETEVLKKGKISESIQDAFSIYDEHFGRMIVEQSALLTNLPIGLPFISLFSSALPNIRVYQFYPQSCRESSAPTPNPKLDRSGGNLPALIDWLQKNHPKAWEQVTAEMQDILQGLNQISLQYLHTKALGLFFEEEGFGRSWNVDEISDGTIQTLAILAASADPRTSLLLIEEPENSVHPWIVRMLVERLKKVSKTKNVIVTSQSPVLVDELSPREVWIVARQNGETQIRQLTDLDPLIEDHWKAGKYQLSDFLDSGLVPQVVPGGIF